MKVGSRFRSVTFGSSGFRSALAAEFGREWQLEWEDGDGDRLRLRDQADWRQAVEFQRQRVCRRGRRQTLSHVFFLFIFLVQLFYFIFISFSFLCCVCLVFVGSLFF